MSRRFLVSAAIVIWSLAGFSARPAEAQERLANASTSAVSIDTSVVRAAAAAAAEPAPSLPIVLPKGFRLTTEHRSFGLMPFYMSSIVLHVLDVHSTFRVIDRGGREGNPMLAGLANNRPAFIAVKGAIAASSVYAVSRIAKKNKFAAFALSAALNSAYGMVVSHNYKLAASLR